MHIRFDKVHQIKTSHICIENSEHIFLLYQVTHIIFKMANVYTTAQTFNMVLKRYNLKTDQQLTFTIRTSFINLNIIHLKYYGQGTDLGHSLSSF